jgi:hypothetical protein
MVLILVNSKFVFFFLMGKPLVKIGPLRRDVIQTEKVASPEINCRRLTWVLTDTNGDISKAAID